MAPEILAGKLSTLAKRTDVGITEEFRGHLELAASYLIAAQDLRDAVEDKPYCENQICGRSIKSALSDFDDVGTIGEK